MVMYKIDRRGSSGGGVQKSFSRTDPDVLNPNSKVAITLISVMIKLHNIIPLSA